jgi:hypothetical protein
MAVIFQGMQFYVHKLHFENGRRSRMDVSDFAESCGISSRPHRVLLLGLRCRVLSFSTIILFLEFATRF